MPGNLSEKVISLLHCPETGQPLREATPAECDRFEADLPEGAWITEDGSRAYPVRDGFPVLVAGEAARNDE